MSRITVSRTLLRPQSVHLKASTHIQLFRWYSSENEASPAVPQKKVLQSSTVPSSRISRLMHYGGLATSLGIGAIGESLRRAAGGGSQGSVLLSPGNLQKLVRKLTQMRGAVLKVGQLLSFQDDKFIPKDIQVVLQKVQNGANYMPPRQLEKVMKSNLGPEWKNKFASFEEVPMAAASIGQVHGAVLKDGTQVAVKVQYPGVAESIDSDLDNLMILLTASSLLPEGLFLDKTIANAREELKWECDYVREAQGLEKFKSLLADDSTFVVPKVHHELSTTQVLTMDRMQGSEITSALDSMPQKTKDWLACNVMRLCLLEIAKFGYMQTDPNWANFLYNSKTHQIELLDFGAARSYGAEFLKNYLGVLRAAVRGDRDQVEKYSLKLGYLTGLESPSMLAAHIDSILVLAEPFSAPGPYDFKDQTVTERVRENIGVMLKERLTPPPEETYGLHRKLSGAFLLCAKMQATIPCSEMFKDIVGIEEDKP